MDHQLKGDENKEFPLWLIPKVNTVPTSYLCLERYPAAILATNRSAGDALSRQSEEIYRLQVMKHTSREARQYFELWEDSTRNYKTGLSV